MQLNLATVHHKNLWFSQLLNLSAAAYFQLPQGQRQGLHPGLVARLSQGTGQTHHSHTNNPIIVKSFTSLYVGFNDDRIVFFVLQTGKCFFVRPSHQIQEKCKLYIGVKLLIVYFDQRLAKQCWPHIIIKYTTVTQISKKKVSGLDRNQNEPACIMKDATEPDEWQLFIIIWHLILSQYASLINLIDE